MKRPTRLGREGVEITGFDASKEGRQTITIITKELAQADVLVRPKPALNIENTLAGGWLKLKLQKPSRLTFAS